MKVLFLDSPSFGKLDLIDAFKQVGYEVQLFDHKQLQDYNSKEFDTYFDGLAGDKQISFVFSLNYYPSISNGCSRNHLKYLSFVYDSPLVSLYSYTLINPCNYIFLFDKAL